MDKRQCHAACGRRLALRASIFDLDGTLLDTLADIASACNATLAKLGYPQHPLNAYATMVGNGFEVLIKRALPQDRQPDACDIEEITQAARAWYASHLMDQTKPYDGMAKTLADLAESGIKLGVLSNKPDQLCVKLIRHYFPSIPFVIVRGASSDIALKPDPGALLSMLEAMSIPASSACYIGDSDVDMRTAINAGVKGIGAAWGFRGRKELEDAGASVVIDSPAQLVGLTIPTK